MRRFYETVMRFPVHHAVATQWVEYRCGVTLITLTQMGFLFDDAVVATGLQACLSRHPGRGRCLRRCPARCWRHPADGSQGSAPGAHRTVFFRDPDGNTLEIHADL
jgi:catechol 2,3-dioxygenase-like lactoylglutathione lyase family enzyme